MSIKLLTIQYVLTTLLISNTYANYTIETYKSYFSEKVRNFSEGMLDIDYSPREGFRTIAKNKININ